MFFHISHLWFYCQNFTFFFENFPVKCCGFWEIITELCFLNFFVRNLELILNDDYSYFELHRVALLFSFRSFSIGILEQFWKAFRNYPDPFSRGLFSNHAGQVPRPDSSSNMPFSCLRRDALFLRYLLVYNNSFHQHSLGFGQKNRHHFSWETSNRISNGLFWYPRILEKGIQVLQCGSEFPL